LPEGWADNESEGTYVLERNLDRFNDVVFDDHAAAYLIARIDQEFALAVKVTELSSSGVGHDTKLSASTAQVAQLENLFPLGVPESADLRDAILELQTKRSDDNTDRSILREFFEGDEGKAKKIEASIRSLRLDGRTTLSKRTQRR
jgi:hypothetical protein